MARRDAGAPSWWLYALLCKRGGIYIGVSPTPADRVFRHFKGKGALYTKLNPPIAFLWAIEFPNQTSARRWECKAKSFKRAEKFQIPDRFLIAKSHMFSSEHELSARWNSLCDSLERDDTLLERESDLPLVFSLQFHRLKDTLAWINSTQCDELGGDETPLAMDSEAEGARPFVTRTAASPGRARRSRATS